MILRIMLKHNNMCSIVTRTKQPIIVKYHNNHKYIHKYIHKYKLTHFTKQTLCSNDSEAISIAIQHL